MADPSSTLYQALRALSHADGDVTEEEEAWLARVLEGAAIPPDEAEGPGRLDLDALPEALPTDDDRRTFLGFMLMVSLADGTASSRELELIGRVAEVLEVPPDDLEEMRRSTILAINP